MNLIWNKNISLFQKRFPLLFDLTKETIDYFNQKAGTQNQDELHPFWKIIPCKNGTITALENGLRLHSAYNPHKEAETFCTSFAKETEQKDAIAFFGFGLGYSAIQASIYFSEKTILIIEPDINHFLSALLFLDFETLFSHNSLILAVGCKIQDAIGILNNIRIKKTYFIKNQSYCQHAVEYFQELNTLIKRNLNKENINNATLERFRKLWFKNSLKNISKTCLLDGVEIYKNKAKQLPFLVMGAGPSLDIVLPHIHKIKNKIIVVAVDTALKACIRHNYQPDFIIITDPQYWAYMHICGLKSKKSILILENAVYPSVYNFCCKKITACSSQIPIGTFFENHGLELGSLGAGGSVASCAWNFCELAGAQDIYVCGLDLGFPDMQTHIKGSTFEEATHSKSSKINPAESASLPLLFSANPSIEKDFLGNNLLTDQRMKMFAWWFESRIAACPHTNTYTLSPKGLKIPGIKIASIKKVLNLKDISKEKEIFLSLSNENEKNIEFRKKTFENAKKEFNSELKIACKICEENLLCLTSNQNIEKSKNSLAKEIIKNTKIQFSKMKISKIIELIIPTNFDELPEEIAIEKTLSSIKEFCIKCNL